MLVHQLLQVSAIRKKEKEKSKQLSLLSDHYSDMSAQYNETFISSTDIQHMSQELLVPIAPARTHLLYNLFIICYYHIPEYR